MSTPKWLGIVSQTNAKLYVLPEGWDSRDKVAGQLDCSPERVSEQLRPAIKAGSVESKVFPVWDNLTKRVLRVTAYRQIKPSAPPGR